MRDDPGSEMKARLRGDLRTAMKERNQLEARVIRSLVAAIDNVEAPAVSQERAAAVQHEFGSRSAEIERLRLTWLQVHETLLTELQEREHAAAEFFRLGKRDHAEALRGEALVVRRYLV